MKKMEKTCLSSLLVLISSSFVVSEWSFPFQRQQKGCQKYLDPSNCKETYYCWEYVNSLEIDEYDDQKYHENNCDGHSIHLKYRGFQALSNIPVFNGGSFYDHYFDRTVYMQDLIVELDLSSQVLSYIPPITSMNNLKLLNFSRNLLTEAKLYNGYQLKSLEEIDYSNNRINAIEVREDLHYYNNLKTLNMSHNQIANIPDNVFELFKNMEYLDMSYNFINELKFLTFDGLKNLLHLNLSHNEINDINISLIRFNKLIELDLSFNKLTSLASRSFENVVDLKNLNLSNNEIDSIEIGTLEHLVSLVSLDLSYNKLNNVNKDMFKNHVYLKSINLSNNNLKSLPTRLFISTVSEILIKNNHLEGSLSSRTFENLELVTDLDFSFQYYTAVDDFAFIGMKNLKSLNFKDNEIVTLGQLCFKTLNNLITLDLSSNRITSIDFDKSDLSGLRELYLQHNSIAEVTLDSFKNLHMLEFLDISDNKINVLPPYLFTDFKNVKYIELKGNPLEGVLLEGTFDGLSFLPKLDISEASIDVLNNNSFNGMAELKELNISHSNVSELQFNVFENTGAIEILDLSFNKLNKFEVNCSALINLNQLLLNNNVLKFISSVSLKNLHRLNTLHLSHNEMQVLQEDIFVNTGDLRYLDVSFNTNLQFDTKTLEMCPLLEDLYLSSIKTNITFSTLFKEVTVSKLHFTYSKIRNLTTLSLGKLSHIEDLFLDHNEIENVKKGDFYNLSSLRKLDLSYNNITYIQPGAFKDNTMLYTLNVSHNNIASVSYGIFRGLNYLSIIDFSYNIIDSLEKERFYEVNSLTELYVDHNKIKSFDALEFSKTNLAKISIGDNQIPCDMLVNIMNMHLSFNITSIYEDDNSNENVNGITCITKLVTNEINKNHVIDNNNYNNDRILTEMTKMMQNMSKEYNSNKDIENTVDNNKILYVYMNSTIGVLNNLTSNVYRLFNNTHLTTDSEVVLNNLTSSIYKLLNNTHSTTDLGIKTNILLNKILTAMTAKRTPALAEPKGVDNNGSTENIFSFVQAIKQDLQVEIAKEKENILSEVERKFSSLNKSRELILNDAHSEKHTNIDEVSHSKSLTFVEICLGIIVTVLLGFVIFKIYIKKSSFTPRQTCSTRNLPDALENSTL